MKKAIHFLAIAMLFNSCHSPTAIPREKHRVKMAIGYVRAIHDPGKGADTTRYFYNPDGHIAHVTFSDGSKYDYEYLNSFIIRKYYDGRSGHSYMDTCFLNKKGLVERWISDKSLPYGPVRKLEYNADNYVVKNIVNDKKYSRFQYRNGNQVSDSVTDESGTNVYTYTYDNDHINTIGNANMGQDFQGTDSRNPVKMFTVDIIGLGPGTYNCHYQYDEQGRIIVKANYGSGSGRLVDSTAYTYY